MTVVVLMNFELDQYFTPPSIARRVVELSEISAPKSCLDTTCGMGALLHAARDIYGTTKCIGIDKDRLIISKLRKSNPDWVLSSADLLSPKSYNKTKVVSQIDTCDLLTLNPPFSKSNKKFEVVYYKGFRFKCSVAMAHVLKSLELFKPQQGAVVIVPESLMFSHLDAIARLQIKQTFSITKVLELDGNTFSGARARTIVIKLEPGVKRLKEEGKQASSVNSFIPAQIIRGGLPVHELICSVKGDPFIHTTDFTKVLRGKGFFGLKKTTQIRQGRMKGWVILLPRVGLFHEEYLHKAYLPKEVQISDCIIALKFESKESAGQAEVRIQRGISSLLDLYRGTGARYITLTRIKSWLLDKGIIAS